MSIDRVALIKRLLLAVQIAPLMAVKKRDVLLISAGLIHSGRAVPLVGERFLDLTTIKSRIKGRIVPVSGILKQRSGRGAAW